MALEPTAWTGSNSRVMTADLGSIDLDEQSVDPSANNMVVLLDRRDKVEWTGSVSANADHAEVSLV